MKKQTSRLIVDSGKADPVFGFRAPVEFKQMVEAWAEENGYSFSAACRRIITLYLKDQQQQRRSA